MDKMSVLIIDDNETDRYILKRHLKETNLDLKIFEEEDGKYALDFFNAYVENQINYPEDFPPLVIFLDINMPLVGGFKFLKEFGPIRAKYNIKTSFIMMFSSSEREEDKQKSFAYDYVKGYLTKGKFSSEQLQDELCRVAINK